jgi:hypothetical protein
MGRHKEHDIGVKWVYLPIKLLAEEHKELKRTCFELEISMQEFIRRLLAGAIPTVDRSERSDKSL